MYQESIVDSRWIRFVLGESSWTIGA